MPEAGNRRGTILAERPISPTLADAGGNVLSGLAGAASPVAASDAGPATEFIVRETGGETIAVVQTNELQLKIGDPVVILRGDRTRLTRPGA